MTDMYNQLQDKHDLTIKDIVHSLQQCLKSFSANIETDLATESIEWKALITLVEENIEEHQRRFQIIENNVETLKKDIKIKEE